ncbi:cytochrome c3 family protein [Geomonas nitrogeniifigens]|uniref:cytochrome c3 family protein n=1 Tax=Geomonas diazotrophica TaxID=2843197 RepID=UPI001C2BBA76|nr:cytochrome c3 family protein [Geomonas nitrogeniifigens]QXE85639.1 cytochrome c3 family protein [Geomonas nitrogeniifigens]
MTMLSFASTALAALALFCCSPALGATCTATQCHASLAALQYAHVPVRDGDCSACHTSKGNEHPVKGGKSFELAAKSEGLCRDCHDGIGKKAMVHAPVKEGECLGCHEPHGAAQRFLLEVGEDRTALCLNCHDAKPFKEKYLHGPVALGFCNTCHDPHDSGEKALLKGKVRDVCLNCHADFGTRMRQATVVHPPVAKDTCTACHDPHGSPYQMFVKNKLPDLCTGCHKNVGKVVALAKVPHKPMLQEGGCPNCHSSHYGKAKGMLLADQKALCLGCHGTDTLGTPPLKNISRQIEGKPFLHGPLQKGDCRACHDPHGSNYFRLLKGNYPEDLYFSYKDGAYDACLRCHERNLLRFPETTIYTKFRNGNRNLHYLHVVARKGRTCRICHEPHASDGVKLINKEGAQFGGWKIPLHFAITPTGGSCAPGCHREFKYDRVKAEVYR